MGSSKVSRVAFSVYIHFSLLQKSVILLLCALIASLPKENLFFFFFLNTSTDLILMLYAYLYEAIFNHYQLQSGKLQSCISSHMFAFTVRAEVISSQNLFPTYRSRELNVCYFEFLLVQFNCAFIFFPYIYMERYVLPARTLCSGLLK